MAKIKVAPIEPLEIEFQDGTIKTALFNNECFFIFENEFGDLQKIAKEEAKIKPYNFCAKILYCGLKVVDKSSTLEEAEKIIMCGGEDLLQAIVGSMVDNFMAISDEKTKENFTKEVEKQIKQLMNI